MSNTDRIDLVVGAIRRIGPGGAPMASRVAAAVQRDEIVDVLCDLPRLRAVPTPYRGIVAVSDGVLVCTGAHTPTPDEIAAAIRSTEPNPAGIAIGDDAWLVREPNALLVNVGTTVEAGEPLARTMCRFDDLADVMPCSWIARAIAAELAALGLTDDDAQVLGDAMLSCVEQFASIDDLEVRTGGRLVRIDEFEAVNELRERAGEQPAVARVRVVGIAAHVERAAEPQLPWLASLGVAADHVRAGQYVRVSSAALLGGPLVGVRIADADRMFTGWLVTAAGETAAAATFGQYLRAELAAYALPWLAALSLPAGWSFHSETATSIRCTSPAGSEHALPGRP